MTGRAAWDAAEAELAADGFGPFVRPRYGGRSLPNVAASLCVATGHEALLGDPVRLPVLDGRIAPQQGRRAEGPVVVLLVDGLGWRSLRPMLEAPGEPTGLTAPAWRESARPITTVFPTTTTCALTSLSTATSPSRHGIAGHRLYLPRYGLVADLLRMSPSTTPGSESLIGPGWSPRELSSSPTIFEAGVEAAVVSRDRFAGTGFTRLLYTGAEYVPYSTASNLAYVLAEVLTRARPPETVFVYWDELDTAHHLHGPDPFLFGLELSRLEGLLAGVARRLTERQRRTTQLWVTGDHGQVPVSPEANVALDREPELLAALRHPPAGDRRAGFFAFQPGATAGFVERLRPKLPPASVFEPMERAVASGLFGPGPTPPDLAARLGELLVLPAAPAGITYVAPGFPPPLRALAGAHGGLEPEELWVPLVTDSLDRFVPPR